MVRTPLFALTAFILSVLGLARGWAQETPCAFNISSVGFPHEKSGPFTAVFKTTFEHKLADGNQINTTTLTRLAQDASGRVFQEGQAGCYVSQNGQRLPRYRISINDRKAKIMSSWATGEDAQRLINISHYPDSAAVMKASEGNATSKPSMPQQNVYQLETKFERLGTRAFDGIAATGTRRTRVIPSGEEGNSQPIETVNEVWFSEDLGLAVMTITDDPRSGRTVTQLAEIKKGDPDPALFKPPSDYAIIEQGSTVITPAQNSGEAQGH
ncbi:hypothetical protein [Edaphobacter aggregans]|uniref:hypothetical protein n=1 Tax=Edaphobacter aggregans TaxID=570835 RepID=UPI00055119DD|nr:hypothetical protein [Edaphobacter aggregans]